MTVISVKNLVKNYGDTQALRDISFEIEKGEVVGFLGPNGAGKTTTMKILTCFLAPTSGEAHIAGHDCVKDPVSARRKIGYLPENNPLYPEMTVAEYIRYMAELHDVPEKHIGERIKVVAGECGLLEKLYVPIGHLSKGYRQRVGLAAALVHDPDILILDEPTVGLDPNQIVEIRNLIKKLGKEKTVILCSHILAEVEVTCNRIMIINEGQIVASGTSAELMDLVKGHASLKLIVRGDKKEVTDALKTVAGVKKVQAHIAKEKGAYVYDVTTLKNRDIREAIAQTVFEKGFKLIEIHKEAISLEEIFNQVTKN